MAMQTQEVVDRFATQAMAAILGNNEALKQITGYGPEALMAPEGINAVVTKAYEIAAAMIAERARRLRVEPEFKLRTKEPKL